MKRMNSDRKEGARKQSVELCPDMIRRISYQKGEEERPHALSPVLRFRRSRHARGKNVRPAEVEVAGHL